MVKYPFKNIIQILGINIKTFNFIKFIKIKIKNNLLIIILIFITKILYYFF